MTLAVRRVGTGGMEVQSQLYSEFKGSLTLMGLSQRKKKGGGGQKKKLSKHNDREGTLSQDDLAGKSHEKPEVYQACCVAQTLADQWNYRRR